MMPILDHNKILYLSISSFLVVLLLTGSFFAPSAHGDELTGSWENDIYLSPSNGGNLIDANKPLSTLSVSYSTGGITYSSNSVFYRDKYASQSFEAGLQVGILDLSSTASFNPGETRLDYWLNEASFSLAGAWFDTTFLLQHSDDSYGAGAEVGVSGNLAEGVSADFTSRFGMKESEVELLGLKAGSGYNLVTSQGAYGPSQLQYVNSEFQITGMMLDCCEYDVTTKFSEANGFEKTEFEFAIEGEENPIGFEVDLKFTAQTKSVVLDPSIVTEWGCFDVYTNITTPSVNNKLGNNSTTADTLTGFQVKGFGLSNVSLGHVTFSSLTALEGNLYKSKNVYNIDLRADDYLLQPSQEYAFIFDETDYDQVFSLYKSGKDFNLTFGADFYFDMSGDATGTDTLFDNALVTGDGDYKLSDQFSMGAGFAIKPESLETIRLSFDYSF
ncbi:hypothetical protein KGY79_13090 [Candidatus Bipolaricaulota bacterium]|nr:hypothetical protein [Candidatus Bipolaricaulota bacterium]